MARGRFVSSLLFWFMFIAGGGALFACLFLPPWLELRALREAYAADRRHTQHLEDQLARVTKQIEHIQSDPAYLERLAQEEFGTETPGVQRVPVEITEDDVPIEANAATTSSEPNDSFEVALERATRRNPYVAVFVLDATRPIVMIMAGAILVAAFVLVCRDADRPQEPKRP